MPHHKTEGLERLLGGHFFSAAVDFCDFHAAAAPISDRLSPYHRLENESATCGWCVF